MENSYITEFQGWWYYHVIRRIQDIPRKIAWMLPRDVALWAFVRVYVAGNPNGSPGPDYINVYKEWQKGAGK